MLIDAVSETNVLTDGGSAIVAWFKAAGIDHVFSVSGGPINSVYRACAHQGLPLIHARHEAAACFMAEAQSRVTGRAGAAVVTLGPGVTNAVTPGLVAMLAGTPMIIIGAQAATKSAERGAGMSYDVLPIMKGVTKWAAHCSDPDRLQDYLEIAWRKMWAGRPGPVFIEVPTDVLSGRLTKAPVTRHPQMPGTPGILPADAGRARELLSKASKPIAILGDELFWRPSSNIVASLEKHGIPFSTLRLARGIVDERHGLWMGPGYAPCNATLRRALREADCVLLLGHHFEFDLEFGDNLGKDTRVIQVCSDPELLHRNRRADLAIAATPAEFVDLLGEIPRIPVGKAWSEALPDDWHKEWTAQPGGGDASGLHPLVAVDAVTSALPENAIFVTSHGNVDFWADARLRLPKPGRYLRAGQSGALGAEVPYGAGASFADPAVPVVVFCGDGGVGFHVSELDTAERYGRAFIIVVLDDESWGAIALPQEMSFGETYQMDLPRRDWRKVAEGLGGLGYLAKDADAIKAAVSDAVAKSKPAIIQVPVRSVISPYMSHIS